MNLDHFITCMLFCNNICWIPFGSLSSFVHFFNTAEYSKFGPWLRMNSFNITTRTYTNMKQKFLMKQNSPLIFSTLFLIYFIILYFILFYFILLIFKCWWQVACFQDSLIDSNLSGPRGWLDVCKESPLPVVTDNSKVPRSVRPGEDVERGAILG